MTNGRMPLQDVRRCEVCHSVTCLHEFSPTPRRESAIDGTDTPRSILLPMTSDVESDDRTLAAVDVRLTITILDIFPYWPK